MLCLHTCFPRPCHCAACPCHSCVHVCVCFWLRKRCCVGCLQVGTLVWVSSCASLCASPDALAARTRSPSGKRINSCMEIPCRGRRVPGSMCPLFPCAATSHSPSHPRSSTGQDALH